jgi:hypothetical protein
MLVALAKDGSDAAAYCEPRVPIKYKNCCGDPDNQRMMHEVGRYIHNFIRRTLAKRKKKSFMSKLAGFFRRDRLEKDKFNIV